MGPISTLWRGINGGPPGALLDLAILGAFTLILSAVLLDEFDEKLRSEILRGPMRIAVCSGLYL